MPESMWMTAISVVSVLLGGVLSYAAFARNQRKDNQERGSQSGMLLTEIGYVKAGIDDIKRKQEISDTRHIEVISRLTAVESSVSQAHKRIDTLVEERRTT